MGKQGTCEGQFFSLMLMQATVCHTTYFCGTAANVFGLSTMHPAHYLAEVDPSQKQTAQDLTVACLHCKASHCCVLFMLQDVVSKDELAASVSNILPAKPQAAVEALTKLCEDDQHQLGSGKVNYKKLLLEVSRSLQPNVA